MKVCDLVNKLNLQVYAGEKGLSREITGGYTSDLLSDVMGNAEQGEIWVTLQTHKNTMAIASLKDLAAIVLVKGNQPEADTAKMSNEEEIPILGTTLSSFEITGRIFEALKL
ncbi:MAG: serine kinase [Bacteroidota bacterium]|nr:serine kinase [Bacteroidota bacterium]MDP4205069.1 serine kinase [Bacteroidota bacterium]